MCRLVGWVATSPTTLADVLGETGLDELAALSRHHADGWGMAWWDGDALRATSSHLPAYSSAEYADMVREVRSDAALLHLRWATPGIAVAPENTHPFLHLDQAGAGEWAFGHNGAVRPAAGLLPMLAGREPALRGDTDSERLMHVLLARVGAHGLDEGLRRTVTDVCRDLTPSSLNSLLLGREELTAVCCHGLPAEGAAPPVRGPSGELAPPEEQPGYFDLRWRRAAGCVVVASESLGARDWTPLPNGTALVVRRRTLDVRTVDVGTFPAATLERERSRRAAAARLP